MMSGDAIGADEATDDQIWGYSGAEPVSNHLGGVPTEDAAYLASTGATVTVPTAGLQSLGAPFVGVTANPIVSHPLDATATVITPGNGGDSLLMLFVIAAAAYWLFVR